MSNNPKDNVLANRLLIMYMYMEKNFHTLNIRELSLDYIEELVHVPAIFLIQMSIFLVHFFFLRKTIFHVITVKLHVCLFLL